jgi:hypothetical protein
MLLSKTVVLALAGVLGSALALPQQDTPHAGPPPATTGSPPPAPTHLTASAHNPTGGGLVVPGSAFDAEVRAVLAGTRKDVDWTRYTLVNGTWARSAAPVTHHLGKRATDLGTLCAYADTRTCSGGSGSHYWCWHAAYDGQCFALWINGAHTRIQSFWRSFNHVNVWQCWWSGSDACGHGGSKYGDWANNQCQAPTPFDGLFKWHA